MTGISEEDIVEIKSYSDAEVPTALSRLLGYPALEKMRAAFFAQLSQEQFARLVLEIKTVQEFQQKIIAPVVDAVLTQSTDGLTMGGLDKNLPDRKYIYVSNHRDIICDPALFTYSLVKSGLSSPMICLGDNLLCAPWITDLVKVNRGVIVKRNLSQRELLRWSQTLSALLARSVTQNESSVWIAQREGRAKDGNDRTHPGVIKMLALGKDMPFLEKIDSLHLVPLAISYEYDPCDVWKARELFLSNQVGGCQKLPGEDLKSMNLGISGYKGRIHIEIGSEITEALEDARAISCKRTQLDLVVSEIDRQIHQNYRLWPSHYIAFDLMNGVSTFKDRYSVAEKQAFLERLQQQLNSLPEENEPRLKIRSTVLEMYANPVVNSLRYHN